MRYPLLLYKTFVQNVSRSNVRSSSYYELAFVLHVYKYDIVYFHDFLKLQEAADTASFGPWRPLDSPLVVSV